MAIWKTTPTLEALEAMNINMAKHLDIQFTEIGEDFLVATMPVDERTKQPLGLLNGGASCVLAETVGTIASYFCIDEAGKSAVGQSIQANHLRPATDGRVTGTARPVHIGRRTHVWDIEIHDEQNRLICVSRLTTAII